MAIVIGRGLVLSPAVSVQAQNEGIIAYRNVVTFDSISATSEALDRPITNAANPATDFTWEAEDNGDQTISIDVEGREIDYIGIARHNLGQFGLEVRIQFDGQTVIDWGAVSDNQALLFLVNTAAPQTVTIGIRGATDPAQIAVIYIGLTIRLQRRIYVGHTPIQFGRNRTTINGLSEFGQYLGEVPVRETIETQVSLQNLTPQWYRDVLDPFFDEKPSRPCFWVWRPMDYPAEVSFCWIKGNPRVSNQLPNGMMEASWNFVGIV